VTDASFAADVERSPLPVLLDAWAPWCWPCQIIAPMVEEIAIEMAGRLRVGRVNVDENPSTTGRFEINSIPTLLDGSWTATSAGVQCASGTASVRGGLVVLAGTRTASDYCMPYSLTSKDGRMKAVFDTSFKSRETSAMIDLQRVQEPLPAAAQAPTQP
jgi:thioredoxin 1